MNNRSERLCRRILGINDDQPIPNLRFEFPQDESERVKKQLEDYTRRIDSLDRFIAKKYPTLAHELNLLYLDTTYVAIHNIRVPLNQTPEAMLKWKKSYDDLLDALANFSNILTNEPDDNNVLLPLMSESLLNSIRFARESLHSDISSKPKIEALTKTINQAASFYINPSNPETRNNLLDSTQNFLNISVEQNKVPSNLDFIRNSIVVALLFAATIALCLSIHLALFVLAPSTFKAVAAVASLCLGLPTAIFGTALSIGAFGRLVCGPKSVLTPQEKTAFRTATPLINSCGPTNHYFFSGKLYLEKDTWSRHELGEYTPPIAGYVR